MTGAVLKVTCEGHIYRMPFDAELGCAVALTAVHELLPDAKVGAATFPGADGSNRVLTEDTFEEFLTTAMTAPSGRATFKLQMDLPGESAQQEQVAIAQPEPGPQPQGSGGGADGAKRPRSGAVRRAQRRQAKAAAEAARTQWEEDPRDLDQLVSAVEGAPWPAQGATCFKQKTRQAFAQPSRRARTRRETWRRRSRSSSHRRSGRRRRSRRHRVHPGAGHPRSEFATASSNLSSGCQFPSGSQWCSEGAGVAPGRAHVAKSRWS